MEQDFCEIFVSWLHDFAFISDLLEWMVLIFFLVWFERSLHPVQVSGQIICP